MPRSQHGHVRSALPRLLPAEKDLDVTINGLSLSCRNRPTEGVVNKIKLFKRQTDGRAGFRLLRHRILLN